MFCRDLRRDRDTQLLVVAVDAKTACEGGDEEDDDLGDDDTSASDSDGDEDDDRANDGKEDDECAVNEKARKVQEFLVP